MCSLIKAHTGDPVHGLGTNLLKVTIGLSALVFIIMLQVGKMNQAPIFATQNMLKIRHQKQPSFELERRQKKPHETKTMKEKTEIKVNKSEKRRMKMI